MANFDRHQVTVGSKIKIGKVVSGVDTKGLPYWKFYVPFTMPINGNSVIYKHLWCRVNSREVAKEGDWVQISRILAFKSNCRVVEKGGMEVFDEVVVEVEKLVREKNYE